MTVSEIAEAMREGGVTTASSKFDNTLNSILTKRQDLFRRVAAKVWGLVEWANASSQVNGISGAPQGSVIPLRGPIPVRQDR